MVKTTLSSSKELQNNSNKIITLWKKKLQDAAVPKSILSDFKKSSNILLQLILLRIEFEYFVEHKERLAKETRRRLSQGEQFKYILLELRTLHAAIKEVAAELLSPKEYKLFSAKLEDEYFSWISVVINEHTKYVEESSVRKINNIVKWDQGVLDIIPIPILVIDSKGIIQRVNNTWSEQTGIDKEAYLGTNIKKTLGKDMLQLFNRCLSQTESLHITDRNSISAKIELPLAACYGCRAIIENNKSVGVLLLALPNGLLSSEKGEDSFIIDLVKEEQTFGTLMRKVRRARGLTMMEVANAVKKARGYLSNIENNNVIPSFEVIKAISETLDPEGKENLLLAGIISKIPKDIRHILPWF
ncbi:MAG: helix-turn-helix domain-containing protein [Planctomycetota bacterium]|jgi:PAS domain-containing protein/DNA-binding XRE family transcriptional regulator